jgi:hypothetical protein
VEVPVRRVCLVGLVGVRREVGGHDQGHRGTSGPGSHPGLIDGRPIGVSGRQPRSAAR